jgi:hypothetical protein
MDLNDEANINQQSADSTEGSGQLTVDSGQPSGSPNVSEGSALNTQAPLYDANAEQTIRFHTERRGTLYPVAHIFGTDALKHDSILEYERAKDQRLSDADLVETDERDATAISGQSYEAAIAFASKHLARTEGYAGAPSEKDRVFAVSQLFGAEFDELPMAMGDELCPEETDDNSTYRLKCRSPRGDIMVTTHELRAATKEEISESVALQSRVLIVKGTQFGQKDQRIPSKAKRWAELYYQMKVATTGYADKVPLHHAMAVAQRHLKSEQKAITGNSPASQP